MTSRNCVYLDLVKGVNVFLESDDKHSILYLFYTNIYVGYLASDMITMCKLHRKNVIKYNSVNDIQKCAMIVASTLAVGHI